MAEARVFFLRHAQARQAVADFAMKAPDGWRVKFTEPTRNLEINAALHATIGEIAERCEWAGRKWDAETWKRLLVSSWARAKGEHVQLVPALDGQGFDIVMIRTSKLSQSDARDLMGWIDAWMAEMPEFNAR